MPTWGLPRTGPRRGNRPIPYVVSGGENCKHKRYFLRFRLIEVKIRTMAKVAEIHRYPVKGLGPEPLPSVRLEAGCELPFDRHWGLMFQDTEFDSAAPKPVSKKHFLMLARFEQLAGFQTRIDAVSGRISLKRQDEILFSGDLNQAGDGETLARFVEGEIGLALRGRKTSLQRVNGAQFSDTGYPLISLINRASVDAIGAKLDKALCPSRFRGNILMDGLAPWQEADWTGKNLKIGDAKLSVLMPIERCNATNVNPATGERDASIPPTLKRTYGHMDCGVYARVVSGGVISTGADIVLLDD